MFLICSAVITEAIAGASLSLFIYLVAEIIFSSSPQKRASSSPNGISDTAADFS
tara:strand:- start:72 stop:233 length:162 start_codon:yes stop_codon:yes gene_type:complete